LISGFHGDPHAGNTAYEFDRDKPRIIFYDWGMMGRLNRLERFAMTMMAMAVMLKSAKVVSFGTDVASGGQISASRDVRNQVLKTIHEVLDMR
jgi:predicted unusual protein kinase regulating ubiquinone biosynthesis (AarF/ABC1/UbiB family)